MVEDTQSMVFLLQRPSLVGTSMNGKLRFCFPFIPLPFLLTSVPTALSFSFLFRPKTYCVMSFATYCSLGLEFFFRSTSWPFLLQVSAQMPRLQNAFSGLPARSASLIIHVHTSLITSDSKPGRHMVPFFPYAHGCFLSLSSKAIRASQSLLHLPMR